MKFIQISGATAIDDKDGDITNKIVITGNVDTSKEGTYIITYTVEDSSKNSATATRTVIVENDEIIIEPNPDPEQNPTPNPNPEPAPDSQPNQNEIVNNINVS